MMKVLVTHNKRLLENVEDAITFTEEDANGLLLPHNDALVIYLNVLDFKIKCILVDPGILANIIQWRVLEQFNIIGSIIPATKLLVGFNLASVTSREEILLPTNAKGVMKMTLFEVVDGDMGYNIIPGRPWLNEMQVVPSKGRILRHSNYRNQRLLPSQAKSTRGKIHRNLIRYQGIFQVPEETDATKSTSEELEQVALFEKFLERKFHLRTGLHPKLRYGFIEFLKCIVDCFAWPHTDMTGTPPKVVIHKLSLDPSFPPVRQKKGPIAEVRNKFVKEEVTRLLDISSVREVKYPDWLANVVVVK
ncbi:uncharacterized protein [Nicotiana tomentosiformis]|uniref:uncharacterized protein n=1 Tax=Nicotiana tomentosiformis TaxID=4098 RepID=UPI00388CE0D2